MILLEYRNRMIYEILMQCIETPQEIIEHTMADFDSVKINISNKGASPTVVTVSLKWACAGVLLKNGSQEELKAVYGDKLQATPAEGYDVSVQFDISQIKKDDAKNFCENLALLKRHLISGPFKKAFKEVESGKAGALLEIPYRDGERIWIKANNDNVTVVFSLKFADDDEVIARVFLKEFTDARKNVNNAPAVTYYDKLREPPAELKGQKLIDGQSYVTLVLFKGNITGKFGDKSINMSHTFRDYLHYHIKCSKAHMHTLMRQNVENLLQLLNRAKIESLAPKEKKTMSGKTFTKK